MSHTLSKLQVLQEAYQDSAELDRVVDRLIAGKLSEFHLTLQRYDRELAAFEKKYGMESVDFYARFEAGQLGDEMDFFEWSGLWELRTALLEQIQQLQRSLTS